MGDAPEALGVAEAVGAPGEAAATGDPTADAAGWLVDEHAPMRMATPANRAIFFTVPSPGPARG
jgi:hypothetical protein